MIAGAVSFSYKDKLARREIKQTGIYSFEFKRIKGDVVVQNSPVSSTSRFRDEASPGTGVQNKSSHLKLNDWPFIHR